MKNMKGFQFRYSLKSIFINHFESYEVGTYLFFYSTITRSNKYLGILTNVRGIIVPEFYFIDDSYSYINYS